MSVNRTPKKLLFMPELKNQANPGGKASVARPAVRRHLQALKKAASRGNSPKSEKKTGPTTAANLEGRFDKGEPILDYFDVAAGRMRYPK